MLKETIRRNFTELFFAKELDVRPIELRNFVLACRHFANDSAL
jgi:hypothetical protein